MKTIHLLRPIACGPLLLALSSAQIRAADGSDASHIPAGYSGNPMTGTPQVIPGRIQAEAYDMTEGDAKGVTVGGVENLRKTDLRQNADSAGLARYGSGHVSITGEAEAPDQAYVGWTNSGEWLAYTVRVVEPGTYVFGGKFAAGGKGSKISVSFTPELGIGAVEIPTTAGYQPAVEVYHVWETLDKMAEITLTAGVYVMKVKIDKSAGLNMDYFTFTKSKGK